MQKTLSFLAAFFVVPLLMAKQKKSFVSPFFAYDQILKTNRKPAKKKNTEKCFPINL